jgi:hypothetical protein
MADETELELLITVVVSAEDDRTAQDACRPLLRRIGGRMVESGDCSDEEPGCWSVTISRGAETGYCLGPAALSRAVRNFLRELGPDYARHRVSCELPTAWTVVDNPELVQELVTGGERLMVEAWVGGSVLPVAAGFGPFDPQWDPDEPAPESEPPIDAFDEDGRPRPRLGLLVDVVTERRAGAEWPARAVASRLSRGATIIDCTERPPMVRVTLDLGPAEGQAREIVANAVSALGGTGWSRLRVHDGTVVVRGSAAPTPPSGIAAIELSATEAESLAPAAPDRT